MNPPPPGTLERWAWDYLHAGDLAHKLTPPPMPDECEEAAPARRVEAPSRPSLTLATRGEKTPGVEALRNPERRARLVHTFLHHELQAAELMAWAILTFAGEPVTFKRAVAGVLRDELRHMAMYAELLDREGVAFGRWAVNDWFWRRVPNAVTAAHFVAVMGIGFEGANLDHATRFAERFRQIGDEPGARVLDVVRDEEVSHVRFAMHWFRKWTGATDFETWSAHLPRPLSPVLMKGSPIEREHRARAGFTGEFLDALDRVKLCPRDESGT